MGSLRDAGGCDYKPPDQGWGRGERPAINFSWADAEQFAAWMSKLTGQNIPAADGSRVGIFGAGGAATPFWWGKEAGTGHAKCADCGDKTPRSVPVGSFRPNAFGLYDTSGNAAEWVEDCWNPSYKGAPADGSAWTTGDCGLRVLRGGSFLDKRRP